MLLASSPIQNMATICVVVVQECISIFSRTSSTQSLGEAKNLPMLPSSSRSVESESADNVFRIKVLGCKWETQIRGMNPCIDFKSLYIYIHEEGVPRKDTNE